MPLGKQEQNADLFKYIYENLDYKFSCLEGTFSLFFRNACQIGNLI